MFFSSLFITTWSLDIRKYFYVHVTVHRDKFLKIKPTRCNNFSNLFLEWNSTCFGQFLCPSSGVFHCTHSNGIYHTGLLTACEQEQIILLTSCQQTCLTYTTVVCTVKNSWWWTRELSETCRVYPKNKFKKLVHLVGFIIRNLWNLSQNSYFWCKYQDAEYGVKSC